MLWIARSMSDSLAMRRAQILPYTVVCAVALK
jgi:hypothetical protein